VSSYLRRYLVWKAQGDEVEGVGNEMEGAQQIGACDIISEEGAARARPARQEHAHT
jgi:hypothetical protein